MHPENEKELEHLRKAHQLYCNEFEQIIIPKLELEKGSKALIDPYARAYQKMWLKKPDVEMKQFYHGIKEYEVVNLLQKLIEIEDKNEKYWYRRVYYFNSKLKKSKPNK